VPTEDDLRALLQDEARDVPGAHGVVGAVRDRVARPAPRRWPTFVGVSAVAAAIAAVAVLLSVNRPDEHSQTSETGAESAADLATSPVGTDWRLVAYQHPGKSPQSVTVETSMLLRGNGTYRIHVCKHDLTDVYTLDGDSLHIRDSSTAAWACPDPEEMATAMAALSNSTSRWSISNDELTLNTDFGDVLTYRPAPQTYPKEHPSEVASS